MEKLIFKYENACKAALRLKEVIDRLKATQSNEQDYEIIRDSVIQRFEFTIDIFWKFLKYYLAEKHSITPEVPSPRNIFTVAEEVGVISKDQIVQFYMMLSDRNESSHTYDSDLAEEIAEKIPAYWELIDTVLQKHKSNL
jgi:nucleotidyltransferase substrate binding protein (TIGR01987 family)